MGEVWKIPCITWILGISDFSSLFTQDYHTTWGMRHTVTFQEKSKGFANQTFRLLLVGRSRSGFSSPDSDTYYTLGLAFETTTESSMEIPSIPPRAKPEEEYEEFSRLLWPVYPGLSYYLRYETISYLQGEVWRLRKPNLQTSPGRQEQVWLFFSWQWHILYIGSGCRNDYRK